MSLTAPPPGPTSWVSPTNKIPMRLRPTAASSPVVRYQQNCTVQHNKGIAQPPFSKQLQASASPIKRSNCTDQAGHQVKFSLPWLTIITRDVQQCISKKNRKTKNQSAGEDPTPLSVCPKRDTSTPQKKPFRRRKVPRTQMRPVTVRPDPA